MLAGRLHFHPVPARPHRLLQCRRPSPKAYAANNAPEAAFRNRPLSDRHTLNDTAVENLISQARKHELSFSATSNRLCAVSAYSCASISLWRAAAAADVADTAAVAGRRLAAASPRVVREVPVVL